MAVDIHGVSKDVTVKELLEAGLHFGHQTKRWNPRMKRFIFDERNGIYIIDLAKTLAQLKEAQKFLYETVSRGRKVLFVGTKKQAQESLHDVAIKLSQPYVCHRWLGGLLTNNTTVQRSVSRMRELQGQQVGEHGEIAASSKKEGAKLRRELNKLERNLSGIADMERLPGAMVVVDCNRESIAVSEARRLNIPVVALVDTNCNPDQIDFPIPGNDDAIRAIKLISDYLGETIQHAANEYARLAAEEMRRKAADEAAAKAKAVATEEAARKHRAEIAEKMKAEKAEKVAAEKVAAESAAEADPALEEVSDSAPAPTVAPEPAPTVVPEPAPTVVPEPAPTVVPEPDPPTESTPGTEEVAEIDSTVNSTEQTG